MTWQTFWILYVVFSIAMTWVMVKDQLRASHELTVGGALLSVFLGFMPLLNIAVLYLWLEAFLRSPRWQQLMDVTLFKRKP